MFKLEAIRALHGDALLLHYGTADKPLYALIDGGPATVWAKGLQPRLDELRVNDKAVPLRWIAVSHVDDDHVVGVIDLLKNVQAQGAHPASATAATRWLFHNTPGPPAKQPQVAAAGQVVAPDPTRDAIEAEIARVAKIQSPVQLSSYRKGSDLANRATALQIGRNPTTGVRLLAGDVLPAKVVDPLTVRVVSPTPEIMQRLIKEWEKKLGAGGGIKTASEIENRVENLSSIVLLVEDGKKRMLLTGDSLDNDVITGLETLKLVKPGATFKVDLLKLPHHGAKGNNHAAFFERIKAKHYVISANGNYDNPDPPVLELLVKSEKDRAITIWLTNGPGEGGKYGDVLDARFTQLTKLIKKHDAKGIKVRHPVPGELSVTVTLTK